MRETNMKRSGSKGNRGSALLMSLLVMVGLSLLGLGFVAISETESTISVNQRNAVQTQAVAEAGLRGVIEWFQNPQWAQSLVASNGGYFMPHNDNTHPNIKIVRTSDTYVGKYKSIAGTLLFDLPFAPDPSDRLFGTEQNADVVINATTDATDLAAFNEFLFGTQRDSGEVTEIKVYAPPNDGGALVDDGTGKKFWVGGTRYGFATVQVTAQKHDANGNVIASRTARSVIGPFPLPIPSGPIQTDSTAGINFGGSSDVHWGIEMSEGPINDTKNPYSFPWANPYEISHIERGLNDQVWPIQPSTQYDDGNYFAEALERDFGDAWFGTRAFTTNNTVNTGYKWYKNESNTTQFSAFDHQDSDIYPTKRLIRFPIISYDFWKRITKNNNGVKGLYYFSYNTTDGLFYRNGQGTGHPISFWVDQLAAGGGAALGPGIYFFDTTTGANPQNADGTTNTAILTPAISWSSGDFYTKFQMSGFIYLNAASYGSQGAGNKAPDVYVNQPSEPFRDIGYRQVNETTRQWDLDSGGNYIVVGASDGKFNFDDLNHNGRLDIVTHQVALNQNDTGTAGAGSPMSPSPYVPKEWDGSASTPCTIPPANYNGTNGAATDCSEPHEPYINFQYSTTTGGGSSGDYPVHTGWQAGLGTQLTKVQGVTCSNTMANLNDCTSNSYDSEDGRKTAGGALVQFPFGPILDGILFNQGGFDTAGDAVYYGAVLLKGAVTGNGNSKIYFNEALKKGTWAPAGMPRVMMYSIQTDEQ